jgi:purine-cytosine permease-like protein
MVLIFFAIGIVAIIRLNVNSFADFWAIWGDGGEPMGDQIKYTFWHVVIWSWLVNAAMHIGMSDLTIFRYAKNQSAGWTSAAGMYLGHYVAWICAALLYSLYLKTPEAMQFLAHGDAPPVAPGPMAYDAVGIAGLVCVVVAGWTTANPTIYRAGLAFQAIIPKASTFKMTLFTGLLATMAGLFPAVAMKLLDFVALYGFILAPMGAVIVFDIYFSKQSNILSNYAEKAGITFNLAVFISWVLSVGSFYLLSLSEDIFLSFLTVPAWLACGLLFLLISRFYQKKIV